EVGYINDEFRPSVEAGNIEVGPIAFYVDGEESIYIDDSMNFRFLKYDSSGRYVGEVGKDVFTDHVAPLSLYAAAGLDCLFLYEYQGTTLFKYDFENAEVESIDLAEHGIDWEIEDLYLVYDGQGNTYFSTRALPYSENGEPDLDKTRKWYVADPQFTGIVETREVPAWLSLAYYADDEGNLYCKGNPESISEKDAFYVIDEVGNVEFLFPVTRFEDYPDKDFVTRDIFFAYGDISCIYVSGDGTVMEIVHGDQEVPFEQEITRNSNYYVRQQRYYSTDDKSPFCIYEVEVDWGQEVE
ncbi:MAG: hypothetical protein SWK76_00305, partial [Actinomycetota bacterium]|nr:hypothetical protein [Actinomycetota bacterium]